MVNLSGYVLLLQRCTAESRRKESSQRGKPEGLIFVQDFSQRMLDRCAEQKDDLKKARKEGKSAYFVVDRLVIREPPEKNKSLVSNNSEISFNEC